MRHLLMLIAGFVIVVTLILPADVKAQVAVDEDPCSPPGYRTDFRPDPSGGPTEVVLGVRIIDILEITDVDQTIKIDMAVRMRWNDPRLIAWDGCKLAIGDIWFPEIFLKNSGRIFTSWPETATIEEDGNVIYLQRMSGTFSSYANLSGFPFDKQSIVLRIYPVEGDVEHVLFRIDKTFTGMSSLLNISDWKITETHADVVEEPFEATGQIMSGYLLEISAERYLGYYIWKIMIPIAVIVFMSWCAFWIDPKQFGTQIGLSATSVLTMVAFVFATTNMLPRLGYVTLLDWYIAGSTLFVFAALLVTLMTGYLAWRESTVLARRLDSINRWAFPLTFFALLLALYANAP